MDPLIVLVDSHHYMGFSTNYFGFNVKTLISFTLLNRIVI